MAEVIYVSELNRYIKGILEQDILLDTLAVQGEIAGFVHHLKTGHYYFSLRDEQASVKVVMFQRDAQRVPFLPENGMKIIVRGRASLFERDGTFQLYAEDLIPEGIGAIQLALEQLKTRLSKEGLFDPSAKKSIPAEPYYIGVVTSQTGAALQDIYNVLNRRWPVAKILLANTTVQGEQAVEEICRGIRLLDADKRADVIIVARGGGSKEDLWVFNHEKIARTAFACKTPLISAIGHEIDTCILDLVADCRAATPSVAAEICSPNKEDLLQELKFFQSNLHLSIQKRWNLWYNAYQKQQNDLLKQEIKTNFHYKSDKLNQYKQQFNTIVKNKYAMCQLKMENMVALCATLNPYQIVARGYTIIRDSNQNIIPANQVPNSGETIFVQTATHILECTVEKVTNLERN